MRGVEQFQRLLIAFTSCQVSIDGQVIVEVLSIVDGSRFNRANGGIDPK